MYSIPGPSDARENKDNSACPRSTLLMAKRTNHATRKSQLPSALPHSRFPYCRPILMQRISSIQLNSTLYFSLANMRVSSCSYRFGRVRRDRCPTTARLGLVIRAFVELVIHEGEGECSLWLIIARCGLCGFLLCLECWSKGRGEVD